MAIVSPVLEKFEAFAKPLVDSGRFHSENDVMLAAMEALTREESSEADWLLHQVEDGEASGIAEGDVFARVLQRAGLQAPGR